MDCTENRSARPASIDTARTLEFVTSAASTPRYPMTDQLRVLQSAIAVAPCGMAVCNRFGRLLMGNRALGEIFGYLPTELLPRNLRTVIPDIVFATENPGPVAIPGAVTHASTTTLLIGDAPRGREVEGIRKDGSSTLIRVTVSPISSQAEWLFVASIVDLTERQRVESQVSLLQRQTNSKRKIRAA